MEQWTYGLLTDASGNRGIRCLRCNRVSWSQGDVKHRYCGACGYHKPVDVEACEDLDLEKNPKWGYV